VQDMRARLLAGEDVEESLTRLSNGFNRAYARLRLKPRAAEPEAPTSVREYFATLAPAAAGVPSAVAPLDSPLDERRAHGPSGEAGEAPAEGGAE
jgi:hypothetical protein